MPCRLINISSKLTQWSGQKGGLQDCRYTNPMKSQQIESSLKLTLGKGGTFSMQHLLCTLCLSLCLNSGSRDVPAFCIYVRGAPSAVNTGAGYSEILVCVVSSDVVTRHNTPIHNILSTVPQLSISQKALGTLPEDGNVMPKHVGATIHN
jgi:hypothetical protein